MPKGTNQSDTHYCNNNLTRNVMFRGDYTTKAKILISVNSFSHLLKIGQSSHIVYDSVNLPSLYQNKGIEL